MRVLRSDKELNTKTKVVTIPDHPVDLPSNYKRVKDLYPSVKNNK